MVSSSGTEPSPIQAVLFDWGDTLVRYPGFSTDGGGHLEAVEVFFGWFEQTAECPCLAAAGTGFVEAYRKAAEAQFEEMATTGTDQPMSTRLVSALRHCGCVCAIDDELAGSYLANLLDELAARTTVMPDAMRVLAQLGQRFKLAVVSNYPEPEFVGRTLAQHGLLEFFDAVVVSAEVGRMKPHPLPFQAAMQALAVQPTEVVFVGDDLRSDMAGAAALGCVTAWMPRQPIPPTADVHHVVPNLSALLELPMLRPPTP
ncbi:MAG: HAD family hydrolase [Actinomycetota bacterium]|nr:HAD family hydrolase [Actinomycetota bacterium]